MKRLKTYIYTIIFASLFCGCKDDDFGFDVMRPDYGDDYFIIAGQSSDNSRVTYNDINNSIFENDDRLGIFGLDENKDLYNAAYSNVEYFVTTATNLNNPDKGEIKTLRPVSEAASIQRGLPYYLIYYPYDPQMTLEKAKSLSRSIELDQNQAGAYENSDFLWDIVSPGIDGDGNRNKYVSVVMDHIMSNIVVMIPHGDVTDNTCVTVLAQPVTLSGADITEDLSTISYTAGSESEDITAWRHNPNDVYTVFRTAVPAMRDLLPGTPMLRVDYGNGKVKEYRLKKKFEELEDNDPKNVMSLKPGRNYIFSLADKFTPPTIDVGDEDSWVLEVRDPEGDLVGYLCREYLYYVGKDNNDNYTGATLLDYNYKFEKPAGNLDHPRLNQYMVVTNPGKAHDDALWSQLTKFDSNSVNPGEGPISSGTLAVNSQAWVFYNLVPGRNVPDLTSGTVLRFIYDVKSGAANVGYTPVRHPDYAFDSNKNYHVPTNAFWPLPHTDNGPKRQGLFKVRHGHEMLNTYDRGGEGGSHYAYESESFFEYYMHGGTVIWDHNNNIISDFIMPEEKITNETALSCGHIAVKKVDGRKQAFVSYTPIVTSVEDKDGNMVAYTEIKYVNVAGIDYPLRKIGFNQFWFGKSLYGTTDKHGKPLECFNVTREQWDKAYGGEETYPVGKLNFKKGYGDKLPHEKYAWNDILPPGFIYPYAIKGKEMERNIVPEADYDPANDESQRSRIVLLYNLTAFAHDSFLPGSTVTEDFRYPTWKDMIELRRYGGNVFAIKWISDQIRTHNADGPTGSVVDALNHAMYIGSDVYSTNISGLDLRPGGMKYNNVDYISGLGTTTCFFIDAIKDNLLALNHNENDYNTALAATSDPSMSWFEIFNFAIWSPWQDAAFEGPSYRFTMHCDGSASGNDRIALHSHTFAPIRILMSFKDPIGPGSMLKSRAVNPPQPRRAPKNITLDLEEM